MGQAAKSRPGMVTGNARGWRLISDPRQNRAAGSRPVNVQPTAAQRLQGLVAMSRFIRPLLVALAASLLAPALVAPVAWADGRNKPPSFVPPPIPPLRVPKEAPPPPPPPVHIEAEAPPPRPLTIRLSSNFGSGGGVGVNVRSAAYASSTVVVYAQSSASASASANASASATAFAFASASASSFSGATGGGKGRGGCGCK